MDGLGFGVRCLEVFILELDSGKRSIAIVGVFDPGFEYFNLTFSGSVLITLFLKCEFSFDDWRSVLNDWVVAELETRERKSVFRVILLLEDGLWFRLMVFVWDETGLPKRTLQLRFFGIGFVRFAFFSFSVRLFFSCTYRRLTYVLETFDLLLN